MTEFFKRAFSDMKESAKAQHEVDKANFAAVKAESRAQWEEARAASRPEAHKARMQQDVDVIDGAVHRKGMHLMVSQEHHITPLGWELLPVYPLTA